MVILSWHECIYTSLQLICFTSFFWGKNYASCFPCNKGLGNSTKKTHRHRTVTPPKQRRRLFVRLPVCAGVWESGDASRQLGIGKIGVPWKGLEVERVVGFSEDPWERWHIYLSIYIYIYIYVVDFCGKCKWTDIYSTIHGSFGYGRCQVWQFENVSLIHGNEFVLLIELSTLMYCLVYPGNWTWFKLRLVWRVELMEMCCKNMFPSWWVCLHTETLFQCGMYVDLGK